MRLGHHETSMDGALGVAHSFTSNQSLNCNDFDECRISAAALNYVFD